MLYRLTCALSLSCLLAGTLTAAADPFCGKWKLNQDKSKIAGQQIEIQDLGGKKYKFSAGNDTYAVVADGTDQATHHGETMALTEQSLKTWKMIIKKDGKVINSMIHTLSNDGTMQTTKGKATRADGSTSDYTIVTKRVGTGSGFVGTWESTEVKIGSPEEWDIEAYGDHGLTFDSPASHDKQSMNFDGKDYAEIGPQVPGGSASSGKRLDANTLEVTDKIKGKVVDHGRFHVSADGKTLTLTIHNVGQPKPQTIVYDKE